MFAFSLDQDQSHLEIRMEGFWDDAEMDRFAAEMRANLKALRALGRPSTCLVDASNFPVQSQHIVTRATELQKSTEAIRADRIATLVSSAMTRLQASRVADYEFGLFSEREDALAWLKGESVTGR